MFAQRRKGIAVLGLFLFVSSGSPAQDRPQLDGRWAQRDGCEKDAEGKLQGMSRAEASNYSLIEIKGNSIEWQYSLASCEISQIKGGPRRYLARANCEYRSREYANDIEISFVGKDQMTMSFSNKDFPFAQTTSYRRCSSK